MTFVVIVTANHFWIDAALGALVAGVSACGASRARPRPARGLGLAHRAGPGGRRDRQPAPRAQAAASGGRAAAPRAEMRELARNRLIESRLTPNAISLTGLVLNVAAAVLVIAALLLPRAASRSSSARSWTRSTAATRACRARARRSARSSTRRSTASRRAIVLAAVGRLLRRAAATTSPSAPPWSRSSCSLMVVLHPRPRRGARGRVQGRHRDAAGARRDPLGRAAVREGRRPGRLRAAGAGHLRAGGAHDLHHASSASSTCARAQHAVRVRTRTLGVTNPAAARVR